MMANPFTTTFGFTLDREYFADQPPDAVAVVVLYPGPDNLHIAGLVKPGIIAADVQVLSNWIGSRASRFLEHGPEADGWRRRQTDDGWELLVRVASGDSALAQVAELFGTTNAPAANN